MKPLSRKTVVILLVVTVAILAVATFLLNPGRRLADERNNIRIENMGQIVEGITEYAIENSGTLPRGIPVAESCSTQESYEICRASSKDCGNRVVLKSLVDDEYMEFIPVDPQQKEKDGTGYYIVQSEVGRITVCAPMAELGRTLEYIK
jgi:hypothetical protein